MLRNVFFLLVITLFGCSQKNTASEIKTYHSNDNLATHYFHVDNKKHGDYKEYYPSGKLQIMRTYEMDTLVAEKIIDINDKVLVNYVIRDGHYYGLLGSSQCISVYRDDSFTSN
jgi:hypothetical protein